MTDFVKRQLEKCIFVDISKALPVDENTFFIKKYAKPVYALNKCYIVELSNELAFNNNSIIAVNWNNGSCPKALRLKIFVSKSMGKMIYVDSIAEGAESALGNIWSGWLPVDELTQIMEVAV